MARDHARILVAIWADPEFRALRADAQRMYLLACSQARLSYAGHMDYLPDRLAKLAVDETPATVANTVRDLEESRFVIVDHETHELLVRTFVRHDGLLGSPNMVKAMLKDRVGIISDELRDALDVELGKAFRDNPKAAGWKGFRAADPDLFQKVSAKGSEKGSGKG